MRGKWLPSSVVVAIYLSSLNASKAGDLSREAWSPISASNYLDSRAKSWFEFKGADRGEGASKTSCVSCHSLLTYALGRPALRKIAGEKESTAYENKVLDQVKMRVTSWSELDKPDFQLMYDSDDVKKKEARGTEAVLNALILASDDRNHDRKSPSEITQKAFANLWETQLSEGENAGSWDWLNFGYEPWEANHGRYFGASLSAIAIGTAPGSQVISPASDRRVDLLRRYLKSRFEPQNLYNRVMLLWTSTKLDGLLDEGGRKQIIDQLLAKRRDDGGWSLASLGDFKRHDGTPEESFSDGYATGLVLHVLQEAGIGKDDPKVQPGLGWLRANQLPSGAWAGYSLNKKRDPESSNAAKANVGKFMWDAATAYSVLALSH